MNPEVKNLWLAALRSGNYEQGYGQLRRVESYLGTERATYCCLGVLCEVAVKQGIAQPEGNGGYRGADPNGVGDPRNADLPVPVREWAGLADSDPWVRLNDGDGDGHQRTLSDVNDLQEYTFSDIAGLIEEQL